MIGSISNRFGVSMPFIVVLWSSWAANPTLCDQLLHHQQAPSSYYGVDISWPIQHGKVSSNFPWLSHNVDPQNPIPEEYKDMPIQPLGDRQKKYDGKSNDVFFLVFFFKIILNTVLSLSLSLILSTMKNLCKDVMTIIRRLPICVMKRKREDLSNALLSHLK